MKKFLIPAAIVTLGVALGAGALSLNPAAPTTSPLHTLQPTTSLELCPGGFECPDVWDPVICDGGVVYSNACYARRACATGCVPFGDA